MRPADFDQSNSTLRGGPAADFGTTDDVLDLPVFRDQSEIISAWKASFLDRISILATGKVYLRVAANTHPPLEIAGRNPFPFDFKWYRVAWRPLGMKVLTAFNRHMEDRHAWGFSLLQWGQRHLVYVGDDAISLLWIGKSK